MKNTLQQLLSLLLLAFGLTASAQPWMESPYLNINGQQDEWKRTNFYEIRNAFYLYEKDWESAHANIDLRTDESNWEDEENEVPGRLQFKRWEYFMEPRVYPSGDITIPTRTWENYQKYVSEKNNVGNRGMQTLAANWTSLGPSANSTIAPSPSQGRVNFLRFNPANLNILWAGSSSGGLWKSVDAGVTWIAMTDGLLVLGCSDLVIDPVNPNIMYLATGDADSKGSSTAYYSIGVLKSIDGGTTWNTTGLSFAVSAGNNIKKLTINPNHPTILFAATTSGLFRTADAGANWTQINAASYDDVSYKPADSLTVYAVSSTGLFYKSTNSGNAFVNISSGLHAATSGSRFKLGVSPANPAYVYILRYYSPAFGGIYLSTDSGANFTLKSNSPDIIGGYGIYDLALSVNPLNADDVYAGGYVINRSADAGATWNGLSLNYVHSDLHSIEFLPGSATTLFECSDGGISKSTDNGTSWTMLSTNMVITEYYRFGNSFTNPELILAGAQDNGIQRRNASGWSLKKIGDGMEQVIDYTNPDIMYTEVNNGKILKSINGTGSCSFAVVLQYGGTGSTANGAWVTPYAMHPSDHNTLIVGKGNVYRTTDAGATAWLPLSGINLSGPFSLLNCLAYAPSDPNYIYAASASTTKFFVSTDGNNFNDLSANLPAGIPVITSIAVSSTNPQKVWITCSGFSGNNVYFSADAGQSWSPYSTGLPNLPANTIVYQNGLNDDLYVGMDVGVYYRNSTMSSWQLYNAGLPNVRVYELEIQYSSGKLRAATYGRGVWESDLAAPVGVAELTHNDGYMSIYPDPAQNHFTISTSGLSKNAQLDIYNTVGEIIYEATIIQQTTAIDLNAPAGVYFAKITDHKKQFVRKLIIE